MKQLFKKAPAFSGGKHSGLLFFLHNTVILLLFFALVRLFALGFWLCLAVFLLGHGFLAAAELVYILLLRFSGLAEKRKGDSGHV